MFFGLFSSGDEMIDKLLYMALSIIALFIAIFIIIQPVPALQLLGL